MKCLLGAAEGTAFRRAAVATTAASSRFAHFLNQLEGPRVLQQRPEPFSLPIDLRRDEESSFLAIEAQ